MSKFINQSKKTVTQIAYMPNSAYRALRTLAKDHNAEIAEDDKGWLTLTFDKVKTAENVAKKFEADYAEAHDAYVPKSEREPKSAPAKETKPSKPANGKGDSKWQKEVRKYAGKGRSANKQVAAVLRGFGMSAQIGSEGWNFWETIR